MPETASVVRIHPPVVIISVMMPRVAAELASLSVLLAPMNRAAVSTMAGADPGGKMEGSLEKLGRVSKFSLKCVLSPSRRGVRSDFSSWGERRGTEPGTPCHPCLSKSQFVLS